MELNQFPLRIEITNKCNLNCDYCLSLTSSYYRKRPETDFAALKKFIKYLQIRSLFLMGGEVCFYNKIEELAAYCLRKKIALGIVTNGTILDRYKKLSEINKNISYIVSYNKEGYPNRLKLCDRFIKEMNVVMVNILINKDNENDIVNQIKKFHRMRKIRFIKIFSDEQTKKGKYDSLFEYLVLKYKKVYVHDYSLMKGSIEKIDDTKGLRIRCNNPLSLKGNNVSFCKNIEDFGMDITKIDFSKKNNRDRLRNLFDDFQKKMNLGLVEGCHRCRFKSYITKGDIILEYVFSNSRLRKKLKLLLST